MSEIFSSQPSVLPEGKGKDDQGEGAGEGIWVAQVVKDGVVRAVSSVTLNDDGTWVVDKPLTVGVGETFRLRKVERA